MVKKVKRFLIFFLFSMLYSLTSRQVSYQKGTQTPVIGKGSLFQFAGSSADAKCCPPGSTGIRVATRECY